MLGLKLRAGNVLDLKERPRRCMSRSKDGGFHLVPSSWRLGRISAFIMKLFPSCVQNYFPVWFPAGVWTTGTILLPPVQRLWLAAWHEMTSSLRFLLS